nr:hypothetical protein [Tanacetum cinerariifolium]
MHLRRKSGAKLSGGHFIRRLAAHFGLVSDKGLKGLSMVASELTLIDLHELGRLNICLRVSDTRAWAVPAPVQAPQPPPPAPQHLTMSQRIESIEEEMPVRHNLWMPVAVLIRHLIAPLSIAYGYPTKGRNHTAYHRIWDTMY